MGQNKQKQGKEPQTRHKKQKSTCLPSQESHKNAKLEAIICTQRTYRIKREKIYINDDKIIFKKKKKSKNGKALK